MKNRLLSGIVMNRRGLMFKLDRTGLRQFIVLFLPLLLLIYASAAQSGAGDITGTVEDQSGLSVEGAKIFAQDYEDSRFGIFGAYALEYYWFMEHMEFDDSDWKLRLGYPH
jgi:hypothetical protein